MWFAICVSFCSSMVLATGRSFRFPPPTMSCQVSTTLKFRHTACAFCVACSELVQRYGTNNWAVVARELGTGRHPGVVVKAYVQHLSSAHNPLPRPRSSVSGQQAAAAAAAAAGGTEPSAKRQRRLLPHSGSLPSFSGAEAAATASGGGDEERVAAAAAGADSDFEDSDGLDDLDFGSQQLQMENMDAWPAPDTPTAAAAAAGGGRAVVPWHAAADQQDQLCEQLLQLVAKHGHSWMKISARMGLTQYQVGCRVPLCLQVQRTPSACCCWAYRACSCGCDTSLAAGNLLPAAAASRLLICLIACVPSCCNGTWQVKCCTVETSEVCAARQATAPAHGAGRTCCCSNGVAARV